jgi:hypothetical protein
MVSSAKTAIRNNHFARLPKTSVLRWVLVNKARVMLGRPVPFDRYIDYTDVRANDKLVRRRSHLTNPDRKELQPAESRHYEQIGEFFNR